MFLNYEHCLLYPLVITLSKEVNTEIVAVLKKNIIALFVMEQILQKKYLAF